MKNYEYRIAAYFDCVIPSPTIYKNRIYRSESGVAADLEKAVNQYTTSVSYKKHIERVTVQKRPVGEWEDIEVITLPTKP